MSLKKVLCGLLKNGPKFIIYPYTLVPEVAPWGVDHNDLLLTTNDGVKLKCYVLYQRNDEESVASRPTVLIFHGNATSAAAAIPSARVFYRRTRCNVLILSYRGYGNSEGRPSEKGLQMDAQAALDFITSHPVLGNQKIILYGQSLGGAVAIDLAARNRDKISALIVENTFLSIPRLIPWPLAFLFREKWNSATSIATLPPTMGLLMLSGRKDQVVPPAHMTTLWETASNSGRECAEFVEFEYGDHSFTEMQPHYWDKVVEFVGQIDTEEGVLT